MEREHRARHAREFHAVRGPQEQRVDPAETRPDARPARRHPRRRRRRRRDGDGGGGGGSPYIAGLVTFDLYIIDSWDGSSSVHGPDTFEVLINREVHFSETFTNLPDGTQTFRAPDAGPMHLGYHAQWMDSIYLGVEVPFVLPADANELLIDFRGVGLQGMIDESWGIDNVRVTIEHVPAPGAIGAFGLAGVFAARRRRR